MASISIINNNNCYSCRSCEQICPRNCIQVRENTEGFIYPIVDEDLCINCGICLSHCPANTKPDFNRITPEFFAIKLNDNKKIMQSASGGAFAGFSEYILKKDGVVYGAAFTDKLECQHIRVDHMNELEQLKGSKYVESDTKNTYSDVKKNLIEGKVVLFSGCPCQIAGLRKFLKKDYNNLFTIDLICHGVPSRKLFGKYIIWLSKKMKDDIIQYSFRDKCSDGWSCGGKALAKTKTKSKTINGFSDPYYSSFRNSFTYKMACYSCEYADINNRPGDVTIGDFWAVQYFYPDFYSKSGVSEIVINTEKGKFLFNENADSFKVLPITLKQASCLNENLVSPSRMPERRKSVYYNIDNKNLDDFMKSLLPSKKFIMIGTIKAMIPFHLKNIIKRCFYMRQVKEFKTVKK